ncbi:MAG: hypothetical protein VX223_18065 [Myxococcota bacterium]|nr:hypothetical protein [Myxococcota bacterium]
MLVYRTIRTFSSVTVNRCQYYVLLVCLVTACSSEPDSSAESSPATPCIVRCGEGILEKQQVYVLGDGGETRFDSPTDLAVDASGTAYLLNGTVIHVLTLEPTSEQLTISRTIELPTRGQHLHAQSNRLWVSTSDGLLEINLENGTQSQRFSGRNLLEAGEVEWSQSAVVALGGTLLSTDGEEPTGLVTITDVSSDCMVAVSRDEGAMAVKGLSDWQVIDTTVDGFEALKYAESVDAKAELVVVGARGLHHFQRKGDSIIPLGEITIPAPYGISRGWNDEEPSTVHDVAFTPQYVWATTLYGGYLMRFPANQVAIGEGELVPVQPVYTDDDYEVDSRGWVTGTDPTELTRLARLIPDGDDMYVMSALWKYVGHSNGAVLQQGAGGVVTLGGAYSIDVSPDGRHVYTAAWNAADPGTWLVGDDEKLTPGPQVSIDGGRPVAYGIPDVSVASDGLQVFAIDNEFNRLHIYDRDVESGQLHWRADVGDDLPLQLLVGLDSAPDGTEIWATDFDESALVAFSRDPDSGHVRVANLFIDGKSGVDGLHGAEDPVPSPDGNDLYIVSYRDGAVAHFDRRGGNGVEFVSAWRPDGTKDLMFGIEAGALTPDGTRLILVSPVTDRIFVANRSKTGTLSLVLQSSVELLDPDRRTTPLMANPGRVDISAEGDVVISLRKWDGVALMQLTATGLQWRSTWFAPDSTEAGPSRWPNGVALSKSGAHAYVVTTLGDALTTFRLKTRGVDTPDGCGGVCTEGAVAPTR